MPVLPEVGSTMVPPGFKRPRDSASSIIAKAMRSLIEPPGLARSHLTHTSCVVPKSRLMRTCGVLPMVARTLLAFMIPPVCRERDNCRCEASQAAAGASAERRHWRKVRTAQDSVAANGCPPRGEDQSNRDEPIQFG